MIFETASERHTEDTRTGEDGLHVFLASIRRHAPLPHEELVALARVRVREERELREALYLVPEVADALLSDWSTRREGGRVTGVMAEDEGDGSQRRSRNVDRSMRRVARLREQSRELSSRAGEGLRTQVADALRAANFSLELLLRTRRRLSRVRGHRSRSELARADRAIAAWTEARERIVRHNLRLVVKLVGQRNRRDVPVLDMIQEGVLGLVRAAEKFDPEKGFRFSTYAVWWIEQALIRAVQKQSRTVRLPAHVYEQQLRFRRAALELDALGGDAASADRLAERLGLPLDGVDRIRASLAPVRSLDAPAGPEGESDDLVDHLHDPSLPDPTESISRGEIRAVLARSLGTLSRRETVVLTRRFGLDGDPPQTLEEIGASLGLSRERIRQIERRILERLREDEAIRSLAAGVEAAGA